MGHILSTVQFVSAASSFGFHLHEQSILNTLYDYFLKCGHNKSILLCNIHMYNFTKSHCLYGCMCRTKVTCHFIALICGYYISNLCVNREGVKTELNILNTNFKRMIHSFQNGRSQDWKYFLLGKKNSEAVNMAASLSNEWEDALCEVLCLVPTCFCFSLRCVGLYLVYEHVQ